MIDFVAVEPITGCCVGCEFMGDHVEGVYEGGWAFTIDLFFFRIVLTNIGD